MRFHTPPVALDWTCCKAAALRRFRTGLEQKQVTKRLVDYERPLGLKNSARIAPNFGRPRCTTLKISSTALGATGSAAAIF